MLPLPSPPRRARWAPRLHGVALRAVDRLRQLRQRLPRPSLRRLAGAVHPSRRSLAGALLFVAFAVLLIRCTSPRSELGPAPEVQVLLDRDLDDVRVSVAGEFAVEDADGRALGSGRRLSDGRIRSVAGAFDFNGVSVPGKEVFLRSRDGDPFQYGGRNYPGSLRVRRVRDERLEVDNLVNIEDYVAGVLFSEMPANFPLEALKAQAVAARTYARFRLDHGDALLRATDADQVYGGADTRYEQARRIVAETRGTILEVDGRPLCAYFMSTCGGATIDGPAIFPTATREGLLGVPCNWCRSSPKFRWTRTLALSELERRLGLAANSIERVASRNDELGHTLAFELSGRAGARVFPAIDLRRLWNVNATGDTEKLPSFWFQTMVLNRRILTVNGAGYGHGVGMCQWGAAGLAASGRDWREILHYYYRGAELVRRW